MSRVLIVLGMLAAGLAVYAVRPVAVPAVDFVDSLTGPTSANFDIPFAKYMLTPEGLRRTQSDSGRRNGVDRPVVRTRSDRYLARDFVFEVDISIPDDVEDLVFVGVGDGASEPPHNEPNGAFGLRIHHLRGNREVRLAALPLPSPRAPPTRVHEVTIGEVPAGGRLTVRLERAGDRVTAFLPGQDDSEQTLRISDYPAVLRSGRGYLYLANTAEGTVFSNVRVRPRT